MTDSSSPTLATRRNATSVSDMVSDLQRLVEALDRRVPRLERLGEAQIARDAAELRLRAVRRIQEIERTRAGK